MKREIIYADNINDIPNGHIAATVTRTGYVVHEKNLKENPLYILVDFAPENDIDIVERTIYLILAGADVYNRIGVTNLESYLRYEVVYVHPYHDKDIEDAIDKVAEKIRDLDDKCCRIGLEYGYTHKFNSGEQNEWSNYAGENIRVVCNLLNGRCIMGCDIISPVWMLNGDCVMVSKSLYRAMNYACKYLPDFRVALMHSKNPAEDNAG